MFADLSNVLLIRDALWRHRIIGNAAVMIGSGFSRNASPTGGAPRPMPSWWNMAEALCDPLYPNDPIRRDAAAREAVATSGFLRLAQEYYAAFGASALNDRIRALVPDGDYNPGSLHRRLLQLPWADVFSTNWDTLLERSCADVFNRSYDIVRTPQDIPYTTRPRIVKLHGTLPSHPPFIFTEEDYRTYPSKFAPFVNVVQEAMMENVFCLLGFSGDDPNFLHWSGWVRDNLSDNAPKIFLVGWLELSSHRRRMLEARHVMPVDLSALPQATAWPEDLRHRYAAEWFISVLEAGEPPDPTRWPRGGTSPTPSAPYLGTIPGGTAPAPEPSPRYPQFDKPTDHRLSELEALVRAWMQHQSLYPGWLIAPSYIRRGLQHEIGYWSEEFALVDGMADVGAINAMGVLAWRCGIALQPFPPQHIGRAQHLLGKVHVDRHSVDAVKLSGPDWIRLRSNFVTLALAVTASARRAGDRERFDVTLSLLRDVATTDANVAQSITYEECLWSIATGDLQRLLTQLDEWTPGPRDHVWNLRKAGMLAEIGETHRACALLESTLAEVRRGRRRDIDDIAALSLEAWALFLALAFSSPTRSGPTIQDIPEPFTRWRELGIHECDAFTDYKSLERELEIEAPMQNLVRRVRAFDPNRSTLHHGADARFDERVAAAYQMVLLAEGTGLPTISHNHLIIGAGLRLAARALADVDPILTGQLAVRLGTGKDLYEAIFTRTRLARMNVEEALLLRDAWTKRAEFSLRRLTPSFEAKSESDLAAALEGLSRIAVRLPPDTLSALLAQASKYLRHPAIVRRTIFLAEPLRHLLQRILESMSPEELEENLQSIFLLPLPDAAGMRTGDSRWRDPITYLPRWFRPTQTGAQDRAHYWKRIVSDLLNAARTGSEQDRSAAILRLETLHQWELLTEREQTAFGNAIWLEDRLDPNGIPTQTSLLPWVLLRMPQQYDGQALNAVLSSLRERDGDRTAPAIEKLGNIARTVAGIRGQQPDFRLPPDASQQLKQLVLDWTNDRRYADSTHPWIRADMKRDEEDNFRSVLLLLPELAEDTEVNGAVWRKVNDPTLLPLSLTWPLRVLAATRRPNSYVDPTFFDQLRSALLSPDEDVAQAAVLALYEWLSKTDANDQNDQELVDLVREVGAAIATRRAQVLSIALEFARWIFQSGASYFRELIGRDCNFGLDALFLEARYERLDVTFDVPSVRAGCVRLALAMASSGYALGPGARDWLRTFRDDPLPEVRNPIAETPED